MSFARHFSGITEDIKNFEVWLNNQNYIDNILTQVTYYHLIGKFNLHISVSLFLDLSLVFVTIEGFFSLSLCLLENNSLGYSFKWPLLASLNVNVSQIMALPFPLILHTTLMISFIDIFESYTLISTCYRSLVKIFYIQSLISSCLMEILSSCISNGNIKDITQFPLY